MSKYPTNIDELNAQLSSIESQIKDADKKIENLREKKLKIENPSLLKDEKDILDIIQQSNSVDIKIYKEKIIRLEKDVKNNEGKLKKLKTRNCRNKIKRRFR